MQTANELAVSCLKVNPTHVEANYVHGLFIFYDDSFEKGVEQFLKVLELDPQYARAQAMCTKAEDLKARKAKGNELYANGHFREAYNVYTDTLTIDPRLRRFNSILYYNRAMAASKKNGDVWDVIHDCTAALKHNPNYVKPLLLLGRCHSDIRNYDEAIEHFRLALQLNETVEIRRLLDEAIDILEKSKLVPKDYYVILGIINNATPAEVKKAYRKKALIHHPDRHAKASAEMQRKQEVRFKEVDEAYRILSDTTKRSVYDKSQAK